MRILISMSATSDARVSKYKEQLADVTAQIQKKRSQGISVGITDPLQAKKRALQSKIAALGKPKPVKGKPFDPDEMSGEEWFTKVNAKSAFPRKIEGYWRQTYTGSGMPFPIAFKPVGYNKAAFARRLKEIESSQAERTEFKGSAPDRWTGKPNGAGEYSYRGWKWPIGYMSYVKRGVPPSQAFYKFITGEVLKTLPTYGR